MKNSIKNLLKSVTILGISLFLIPTLADLFSKNSFEKNPAFSFLSDSGSIIQFVAILAAFLSGSVYFVAIFKEKKSLVVLDEAANKDPIWNEESLKYQTRFIFYKIQSCLENRETDSLKNYATHEFILWFRNVVTNNNNKFTDIDVTETRIISCQDSLNDNEDNFVGIIKGNVANSNNADNSSSQEFSEMYHFTRLKNDWLLYKIDESSIWNLLHSRNKSEE